MSMTYPSPALTIRLTSVLLMVAIVSDHWQTVSTHRSQPRPVFPQPPVQTLPGYNNITCNLNDGTTFPCKRDAEEIYLPLRSLKKYFEVYESTELPNTDNVFHISNHSDFNVLPIFKTYTPTSKFLYYGNLEVGARSHVKCLTATEGVPLSTQWDDNGYHYVTQVAQFGLSHHADYIDEGEPDMDTLEDGEANVLQNWEIPEGGSYLRLSGSSESGSGELEFGTSDSIVQDGLVLVLNTQALDPKTCFSVDVKFTTTGGSVTITLEFPGKADVSLVYELTKTDVRYDLDSQTVYYGLGQRNGEWIHLARDLVKDLQNGLKLQLAEDEVLEYIYHFKVKEIRLRGHGRMDNMTLLSSIHLDHFFDSADWLVRHQEDSGGWPVTVERARMYGLERILPIWYSAMGQGQAMSVLVRAYNITGDERYLQAAISGTEPFTKTRENGGVLAKFLGVHDWYEEYPTEPSSFVLNGFIYSLYGLYDLKEVASSPAGDTARQLYETGMASLKLMISMYDSGTGTFYDLRHITAGVEPNRAKVSYHEVHTNLAFQMSYLDGDPIFRTLANRWLGYSRGIYSRKN